MPGRPLQRRIVIAAATMAAAMLGVAGAVGAQETGSGTFVDDDGMVFEADIEAIAAAGITQGCSGTEPLFCPNREVSRAEMAAFLVRGLGLPPSGGIDAFTDDGTSGFEDEINALAAAGITEGCSPSESRFCPDDGVTRAQMAAFLVRGLDLPPGDLDAFGDDDGTIFEADIDALAAAGITQGCSASEARFCPDEGVTRAQMASFLARALVLEASAPGPTTFPWSDDERIQQWRPFVETYFPPADVETALGIIRCESVGDPLAVNPVSGTSGLFQHRPDYWPDRYVWAEDFWAQRGIAIPDGADIFDPETNIAVGGWLYDRDGIDAWDGCKAWVLEQLG